ncbi:MAG: NAD(P)H-dependent oxidoreductase subunit E [Planctomycetes bacterium]|nr:NAD(P)H-dependent oxidoreductase subunit E [Planctomycetota bacterium]
MSWQTINRNLPVMDPKAPPVLTEAVREKIRGFFPRYETKRAVLLPALHIVQDALGHISWKAMAEIAALLEIQPSDVIDTISFYTHFWTHSKGKKVIVACRSVSCEVMGGVAVLEELKKRLGIDEHETTADGAYSLVTEECLAGCDHAPCVIINEKLHKRVRAEDVVKLLADHANARLEIPRSDLFDAPAKTAADPASQNSQAEDLVGTTSDVREMRES